jgi:predicted enzyme related to lactoylglutathione lyase
MKTRPINTVLLAEDYEKLVDWYQEALDLDIKLQTSKDYHYTDLAQEGRLVVGICPASEMNITLPKPRANSMVLHVSVDDIEGLFKRVVEMGGKVTQGPSVDRNEGFKFGGFEDPEGNPVWVIENFKFQ